MRSSERSMRLGCSASSRARIGSRRSCAHRRTAAALKPAPVQARVRGRAADSACSGLPAAAPRRAPWSAAGRAGASVARSSWRCTTMSTMPWSRRYSALLKSLRQLLADGLLDHARAGEADQRARLGDVHVAQHRVGGGDAAGGRIGQHHDVGPAWPRAASGPRRSCAAAASATGCLPACARRRRRRT